MSIAAMQWAFDQIVKPSSVKFILVSLADYAADDGTAWPSIASLVEKTCQDRKTIMAALDTLEARGFLVDTGERVGSTKQIKKYLINFGVSNKPESGTVPKTEQSRISSETVPDFPKKSPVFPGKSTVFPPKSTENGTRNPQEPTRTPIEPPLTPHRAGKAVAGMALPDWLPQEAWQNWIDHRKAIKAPMSEQAVKLAIAKLAELRGQGNDPVQVIDQSIMSGWRGIFEIRTEGKAKKVQGFESTRDRSRRQTIAGLTGRKQDDGNGTIIDLN